MKKCIFGTLMVLMAFSSCSKPENDEELTTLVNPSVIEEMAFISTAKSDVLTSAEFPAEQQLCKFQKYEFIAGQNTDAGDIIVGNDNDHLYIKISSTKGFQEAAENLKMAIVTSLPDGRPDAGHFPFKFNIEKGVNDLYLSFSFEELKLKCDAPAFYILIHGDVLAADGDATPKGETAWGGVIVPEDKPWWGYITYTPACCEPPDECKISASAVAADVKCHGASTGSINLTVLNGTAPLNYLWSNGAATEDLAGIQAGTYSVTVTDAHQCVVTVKDIIVLQPSAGISASSVVTDISVFGAHDGAIDVTVSGGTPPYFYLWNNAATTQDITGLGPGTYSVVITDANGCNATLRELLVEEPDEEKPKGIVAFARKTWEPMVNCFMNFGFNSFGWTNGALSPDETFESNYELFSNVEGCGISNATKVGLMKLHYFNGTATATINLLPGYTMSKSALYLGNDMFPKVGGVNTIDPANYPYKHDLSGAATDSFTVNGLSGNIYIIGYILLDPEDN